MLSSRCSSFVTRASLQKNQRFAFRNGGNRSALYRRVTTQAATTIKRKANGHFWAGSTAAGGSALVLSFVFMTWSSMGTTLSYTEASSSGSSSSSTNSDDEGMFSRMSKLIFGDSSEDKNSEPKKQERAPDDNNVYCKDGPGKKVFVNIEKEVLDSLPIIDLEEVRKCNGEDGDGATLLVTYDGIVYDVTEFASAHPGGKDMVLTAAGLDLEEFFANYIIHGNSNEKVSNWLAPLAVGKLTEEDALRSKNETTVPVQVEKRMKIINKNRKGMIIIASTLPFWISVRKFISFVGFFIPPLGRLLARFTPVAVPGYSPGAEPLLPPKNKTTEEKEKPFSVAIIGGGIAGCGAAWALARSGNFDVTVYEARDTTSGNAHTFDWDFSPFRDYDTTVKSCCSVTAWPPEFYKNYTALLEKLNVETVHMPLSWFINSKVPGFEGILWEADPVEEHSSLRTIFKKDFQKYEFIVKLSKHMKDLFTLKWAPWRWSDTYSMYDNHEGFGFLNPLNVIPLYSAFKFIGGSDDWWDIIYNPMYSASFFHELRPFPAALAEPIEHQIPLLENKEATWQGPSKRSENDCNITTCVTWKDAGNGVREVFSKLLQGVTLKESTRVLKVSVLPNGKKRVYDEFDQYIDVDRVIFACAANAIGNMLIDNSQSRKSNGFLTDTLLSTFEYADDKHPSSEHVHAVVHSDPTVIEEPYRTECLKRASNYVEVTAKVQADGKKIINTENQYNFGVQTPGPGVYDLPLNQKPVMLISYGLGEGKTIDPKLLRGTDTFARSHPIYSGWNIAAQLSLRLIQGLDGIYYCANWTTPVNCHDMSFVSGLICAHAIGAAYPFPQNKEAKKDFQRLRDLMGV